MERFALAIIGSGSGNLVVPADEAGGRVALIEAGDFGGTCINRGCIPSKMLSYTADLALQAQQTPEFGLSVSVDRPNWPAIRDRVRAQIEEVSSSGRQGRDDSSDVTVFDGHARFAGPHELVINGRSRIEADQIVIATGGRPTVPCEVTNSEVEFYTSDTIMWLDELPASMVILGGGSVAVEMAHIFSSFGVEIHLIERSGSLMETLDAEISNRFTAQAAAQWNVHLESTISEIRTGGDNATVVLDDGTQVTGQLLLVATGRQPNTEDLDLHRAGIEISPDGHVAVDRFGRAAPGVWALGDCSSPFELKHVANAEARTIVHNLSHPGDLRPLPHDWVPSAIFTSPQIATVGARSQDLRAGQYVEAIQNFGDTAYGWAMQDRGGVCKLYADPETGTLLGAHILGNQASLLIVPLIQAGAHRQRVADLARGQYWIHPALGEVVENALLKLPVDREVHSGQAH